MDKNIYSYFPIISFSIYLQDWVIFMDYLLVLLILLPFILAFYLLLNRKWKADTTGIVVWLFVLSISWIFFYTPIETGLLVSLVGIIDSFKITLMVGASIFMITYMQESGALSRIIVYAKTLKGNHKAWQIMFINMGLGCFMVSIGATPVSILPPILLALGFSPLIAIALPAIGYDPLTTYALLGIPVVVFKGEMGRLADEGLISIAPTLIEAGQAFSLYMPFISTGIALGMLYIAGGKELLFSKFAITIAFISGITAGVVSIVSNFLGIVTLTGVFAGLFIIIVLALLVKITGDKIIDRSDLTESDLDVEEKLPLIKAISPWLFLIAFSLITNLIDPIFQMFFVELNFPITIGEFTVKLRILWQAYTWVLISVILSFIVLPSSKEILTNTLVKTKNRVIRPMISSAIFFAIAWIMNNSGTLNAEYNMVFILSAATAGLFGIFFPLIVPFVGLFGGFVSGSETSAIAMFSRFQTNSANTLGMDYMTLGTSNGIGGGLASVLTPAKVQNAAATIDKIGIEGKVIKKTFGVSIIMVCVLSILTLLWANNLPKLMMGDIIIIAVIYLITMIAIFSYLFLNKEKEKKSRMT